MVRQRNRRILLEQPFKVAGKLINGVIFVAIRFKEDNQSMSDLLIKMLGYATSLSHYFSSQLQSPWAKERKPNAGVNARQGQQT